VKDLPAIYAGCMKQRDPLLFSHAQSFDADINASIAHVDAFLDVPWLWIGR
jgi:hypothetical protein